MAAEQWLEAPDRLTKEVLEQVGTWVASQAGTEAPLVDIHPDQLPGCANLRRFNWNCESLTALFVAGCRAMQKMSDESPIFSLAVPLRPTKRLRRHPSGKLESYMRRLSEFEPPSLYVASEPLLSPRDEEYRFPIRLRIDGLDSSGYHVFFRQYRSQEYIANGWEYDNCVFFEQLKVDAL